MNRRLLALGALLCALPSLALAQTVAAPASSYVPLQGLGYGALGATVTPVSPTNPLPVKRPSTTYVETTVNVSAGAWTTASALNTARQKMILGDATGLGCVWSRTASPVTGEGIPFSGSGSPGSWVFDDPVPQAAIVVKCAAAGVITVVEG